MSGFRLIDPKQINPSELEEESFEPPAYTATVRTVPSDPGATTPLPSSVDLSDLDEEEQRKLKSRMYMRRYRERKTAFQAPKDAESKQQAIPKDDPKKLVSLVQHLQQVVTFMEKRIDQQSRVIEDLSALLTLVIDDTLEFNAQDDMRAAILASRRNPNHPPHPLGIIHEVNAARKAMAKGSEDVREVKEAERIARRTMRLSKKIAEMEYRYEFITGFKLARDPGE